MKTWNLITLIIAILGGLNWGLMGLYQYDLIAMAFGGSAGHAGALARIVYDIVGLSALWQIVPFVRTFAVGEPKAEAAH